MRFHSLGLAHTVTSKDYLTCAFTQKKYKGDELLHRLNHEVIDYGNEASDGVCSERVPVTTLDGFEEILWR